MLIAYILALTATGTGAGTLPNGGRVVLELVTDRLTYHVGQAVELRLAVTNVGATTLFGYVLLEPYFSSQLQSSVLEYCHGGVACVEFQGDIPYVEEKNIVILPVKLESRQVQSSSFVVALNPKTKALVLDKAGDYELRWTTWGIHERRDLGPNVRGPGFSASAFVRVLPVPPSEQAAYDYYVEHSLPEIAQYNEAYFRYRDEIRLAAHTMLTRFPDSIYADAVRIGFKKLLESRVRRGRATDEDRAALDDLRARLANGRN